VPRVAPPLARPRADVAARAIVAAVVASGAAL
jgi:hypothetical protein